MFGRRRRERDNPILGALLAGPQRGLTGLDICRATELGSGTVYPCLRRLERQEVIAAEWEELMTINPETGQPLRVRRYRLTPFGRTRALAALGRYHWGAP